MAQYTIDQVTIQRLSTVDTKGGGYALLLTMGTNVADEVLVKLLHGRGSAMRLTLEDVQLALFEGDDPNAGLAPVTERVWETTSGDVVKAHAYASSSGEGACDTCGHSEGHEAHQQTEAQKLAEKLLQDEAAGDPDFPGSTTEEQQEARRALASRSRSSRNGG